MRSQTLLLIAACSSLILAGCRVEQETESDSITEKSGEGTATPPATSGPEGSGTGAGPATAAKGTEPEPTEGEPKNEEPAKEEPVAKVQPTPAPQGESTPGSGEPGPVEPDPDPANELETDPDLMLEFESVLGAAQSGDAASQYDVGDLYAQGKGVRQDKAEAFTWWLKAAEQGHVPAAYNVAMSYQTGDGVAANEKEAAKWFAFYEAANEPEQPKIVE